MVDGEEEAPRGKRTTKWNFVRPHQCWWLSDNARDKEVMVGFDGDRID